MKLKNRNAPIPNGFDFRFPQLSNWRPSETSRWTFNGLVNEVQNVIIANPNYARNYSWPSDRATIEKWVEDYNCKICAANHWYDFLEGGQAAARPFPQPGSPILQGPSGRGVAAANASQPSKPPGWFAELSQIATGVKTLADWLGTDGKPVAAELSEGRAVICAACPMNKGGDWLSMFTVPAANLIRRQLEQRKDLKLSTSQDEKLGVCDACGCPLRLKVHVPLEYIKAHMPPDVSAALDPKCWILKEGT